MATINATLAGLAGAFNQPDTYLGVFEEVTKQNIQLNVVERAWAAWYLWMQNDILATGIMSFVMHEVFYFGRCIPWMIIDRTPFFNRYKIQNTDIKFAAKNPYHEGAVGVRQLGPPEPLYCRVAPDLAFPPHCDFLRHGLRRALPPLWKMAMHIAIFFVMEDTWHYWLHRALHYGPLYKNIHKLHHTYSAPFGLAAEYASPLEVMLLALGTVGSPILWVSLTGDLHLITMYMWIVGRLFQAIDSHSGYDFPWSLRHVLPFWAGAEHHDIHHERFIGNYASSFRWWDYMLDTESGPEAAKRRRERKMAAMKAKKAQ
ncbi:C-4 methylsterol oxidase [Apiospora saccharicola]